MAEEGEPACGEHMETERKREGRKVCQALFNNQLSQNLVEQELTYCQKDGTKLIVRNLPHDLNTCN